MNRWLWIYPILAVLLSFAIFFYWEWSWMSAIAIALVTASFSTLVWQALRGSKPPGADQKLAAMNVGENDLDPATISSRQHAQSLQKRKMKNAHRHAHEEKNTQRTLSKSTLVLFGFLIIAAYFLFTEHRAHLGGLLYYLPFLFLLACPLMHLFMHGGHGHHDHGKREVGDIKGDA